MLLSSPLRSEKRLAKEMETHFRLVLVEESVLASEAAAAAAVAGSQSGRDEEEGDSKSEAMDEETSQSGKGEDGGGGKNGGGSQPMARPRLFQARPVKVRFVPLLSVIALVAVGHDANLVSRV